MNWKQAELDAAAGWGKFRAFISKNPLTGFFLGCAAGGVVIGGLVKLLG